MIIPYSLLCSVSDKNIFLNEIFRINSQKTQSKYEYCELFETIKFCGERLKNFQNKEIIYTHGETGRNEPKWGDLPVGWRDGRSVE